jgi:AraC-like DNA-binding protein
MSYFELPVRSRWAACTWEQSEAAGGEQLVVPDASVDLIWNGVRLTLAGPDTRPRIVSFRSDARLIGVRLRPGAAGAFLGLPASQLRDVSVDAAAVLGEGKTGALLENLAQAEDPHGLLLSAALARVAHPTDALVAAAVAALGQPRARVDAVSDALGLSARQLQRRINEAVGYGPKTLQRVLRFRRLQTLVPAPLAQLALDAGYADQAHMTAEVTALAGMPPVRFLKDRLRREA